MPRRAITGRFVPMWQASLHPGTTVVETVRYPPPARKADITRRAEKRARRVKK